MRQGIVHVLEGRRVFGHLTPVENLLAATSMHRDRAKVARAGRPDASRGFRGWPSARKAKAGYLSGGEQQMLAIARALMTEPKLILLDEPSLGLAPFLVDEIFDIIRRINREAGVAVLLVEQNAVAALDIAEQAYLLENGRIVMSGTAAVAEGESRRRSRPISAAARMRSTTTPSSTTGGASAGSPEGPRPFLAPLRKERGDRRLHLGRPAALPCTSRSRSSWSSIRRSARRRSAAWSRRLRRVRATPA